MRNVASSKFLYLNKKWYKPWQYIYNLSKNNKTKTERTNFICRRSILQGAENRSISKKHVWNHRCAQFVFWQRSVREKQSWDYPRRLSMQNRSRWKRWQYTRRHPKRSNYVSLWQSKSNWLANINWNPSNDYDDWMFIINCESRWRYYLLKSQQEIIIKLSR